MHSFSIVHINTLHYINIVLPCLPDRLIPCIAMYQAAATLALLYVFIVAIVVICIYGIYTCRLYNYYL